MYVGQHSAAGIRLRVKLALVAYEIGQSFKFD
jgi:hypothetical protein